MIEEEISEIAKDVHSSWESTAMEDSRYHADEYQEPIKGCSKTKLEEEKRLSIQVGIKKTNSTSL